MPKAPFAVQCPTCHAKFKMGDPKLIGKKKKCPKCSAPFVIKPVGEKSAETDEFSFLDEHLGGSSEEDWTDRATLPTRRSTRKVAPRRAVIEDEFDEDEQPEPRRRAAASPEDKRNKRILIGMLVFIPLMLLGLCATVFFLVGDENLGGFSFGGGEFEVPEEFTVWSPKGSMFEFEYPKDWDYTGSTSIVKMSHGSVSIDIEHADSSVFNLDQALTSPVIVAKDGKASNLPVDNQHAMAKEAIEESYSQYSEFDQGRLEALPNSSRYAIYSYSTFIGTERKGYRASIQLSPIIQIEAMMECDAEQFKEVKPVFLKMLNSVRPK